MKRNSKNCYLVLADGTIYPGKSFGARGDTLGEVVFTTAMTGYMETLTDPSYYGLIVVQTFPLIGNYGVITPDCESEKPLVRGYIVREWCEVPSNFRNEGDIDTFLKSNNIIGLYDIDTRALTRRLRVQGVMNGAIVEDKAEINDALFAKLNAYKVESGVETVSPQKSLGLKPENPKYKVALWDLGAKNNMERELVARDCEVIHLPSTVTAEEIAALNVDGVLVTNGPGDPELNPDVIKEMAKWMDKKIPTMGICLGHQIMALAQGCKTEKLKYGHRGENQPVREIPNGKLYITSQNHGYTVSSQDLPHHVKVLYENVSDGTCEGLTFEGMPCFSVQFHPEAAGGPLDTAFLFQRFIDLMGGAANATK
ncbi:MAG: carbamoyl phosphate synthase small subunit [Clostridiales bacterium]